MGAVQGWEEGTYCKKCAEDGSVGDKEQLAISLALVQRNGALNHPLSPAVAHQTLMVITAEPGPCRQEGDRGRGIRLKKPGPKCGRSLILSLLAPKKAKEQQAM